MCMVMYVQVRALLCLCVSVFVCVNVYASKKLNVFECLSMKAACAMMQEQYNNKKK